MELSTKEEDEIRQLASVLLKRSDINEEVLRKGEEHYTPPIKMALQESGKGGEQPDSLSDDEAILIKQAVHEAERIVGDSTRGIPSREPSKLQVLCNRLNVVVDNVNDAVDLAQGLVAIGVIIQVAALPTYLGYAIIAVALIKLGIRKLCANKN